MRTDAPLLARAQEFNFWIFAGASNLKFKKAYATGKENDP
jgi:hypothetical protein